MKKLLFGLFCLTSVGAVAGDTYLGKGETIVQPVVEKEEIFGFGVGLRTGLGLGVSSNHDWDGNDFGGDSDDYGWEAGIEAERYVNKNFSWGIGALFQDHIDSEPVHKSSIVTTTKDYLVNTRTKGGVFDSVPIYLFGKWHFADFDGVKPYVKTDIGYSFNFGEENFKVDTDILLDSGLYSEVSNGKLKVDNGLYWGAGVGVDFRNFFIDLMYKDTRAKTEVDWDHLTGVRKGDHRHERVVLGLGYNFNF